MLPDKRPVQIQGFSHNYSFCNMLIQEHFMRIQMVQNKWRLPFFLRIKQEKVGLSSKIAHVRIYCS